MIEMKSIYRKTGMVVAVLALLVVMSAPNAMAADEVLTATWVSPNVEATATNFGNQVNKWYQFRFYQPGTDVDEGPYSSTNPDGYFVTDPFVPERDGTSYNGDYMYEDKFNVLSSGAATMYGDCTVWLFKDGIGTSPPEEITSERVSITVNVPIPEFATIAIPIVALLGLVAFYRRKQKK